MADESIPWERDGWTGFVSDYRGDSKVIGMLVLRARKGTRIFVTDAMTSEQIQDLNPDTYWNRESRKT